MVNPAFVVPIQALVTVVQEIFVAKNFGYKIFVILFNYEKTAKINQLQIFCNYYFWISNIWNSFYYENFQNYSTLLSVNIKKKQCGTITKNLLVQLTMMYPILCYNLHQSLWKLQHSYLYKHLYFLYSEISFSDWTQHTFVGYEY